MIIYIIIAAILFTVIVIIGENMGRSKTAKDAIEELNDAEELIDKYTLLVKEGMDKNEAIEKLLQFEIVAKQYSKHELDFFIVYDIGDSKIADLNKDFDWELPPTSEEALRLIRECTLKVKNGDHSKASLHNAIDELYSHEEIQKYYNKDDLFYIVDGNAGLVTKNN
tara:strand:- start:377 stop:877 length:501 start_codon:yes stop_codon:yes gene_type:complete